MPLKLLSSAVYCGADGTIVATKAGRLFACGSNEDNKLGLNAKTLFSTQRFSQRQFERMPASASHVAL